MAKSDKIQKGEAPPSFCWNCGKQLQRVRGSKLLYYFKIEVVDGVEYRVHGQCGGPPEEEEMKTYKLYWSPEGKLIDTVRAETAQAAIKKAPKPYRQYLGEIYAEEVV